MGIRQLSGICRYPASAHDANQGGTADKKRFCLRVYSSLAERIFLSRTFLCLEDLLKTESQRGNDYDLAYETMVWLEIKHIDLFSE